MRSAITSSLISGFSSASSNSTSASKSNEQDSNGHNALHYSPHLPQDAKANHRSAGGNEMIFIKKLIHHREPTIDENAVDGGGSEGDAVLEGKALDIGGIGGGGNVDVADDAAADNNNNEGQQDELYVQSADNTLGKF